MVLSSKYVSSWRRTTFSRTLKRKSIPKCQIWKHCCVEVLLDWAEHKIKTNLFSLTLCFRLHFLHVPIYIYNFINIDRKCLNKIFPPCVLCAVWVFFFGLLSSGRWIFLCSRHAVAHWAGSSGINVWFKRCNPGHSSVPLWAAVYCPAAPLSGLCHRPVTCNHHTVFQAVRGPWSVEGGGVRLQQWSASRRCP